MITIRELEALGNERHPLTWDLVTCVRREIELRRKCYPGWVDSNRMNAREAAWELACMEAVLRELEGRFLRELEAL